ncbi:hypothetical protein B0J17DRAFT_772277 [Rhizoctonia solani]|nr:hypothetical protein B0J17DRAFT_772277 [Rhizoctonia solani]
MSGWYIVTVTIDGFNVRHSPVMELHDGKNPKDSMLLLTHCLSPTFTTSKAPWCADPFYQRFDGSSILPDDVLRQTIYFTDPETHLSLQLVSRYVRLICLAHPRIRHHILLDYEGKPNSEPVFRVRSASSTCFTLATLTRIQVTMDKPLPIWRFRRKQHTYKTVLAGDMNNLDTNAPQVGTNIGLVVVLIDDNPFAILSDAHSHTLVVIAGNES